MAVTIKDIAQITGLAISTISKYLNGGNVLPENRLKIRQAIEKLDVGTNDAGRALKIYRSYKIGIVVDSMENVQQARLVMALEKIFRGHGYGTIIAEFEDSLTQSNITDFLLKQNVDGLVFIPLEVDAKKLEAEADKIIPMVAIYKKPDHVDCSLITADVYNTMYTCTRYLLNKGHQRIGFIGGVPNDAGAREHLQAYKEALKKGGVDVDETVVSAGEYSISSGYERMCALLSHPIPPTAALSGDSLTTLGAVLAIKEKGLHMPDEFGFVGFNTPLLAQEMSPKLSVITYPVQRMASLAAQILLSDISGTDEPVSQHIRVPADIFMGESM